MKLLLIEKMNYRNAINPIEVFACDLIMTNGKVGVMQFEYNLN